MQPINFDIWSGTNDREDIAKYFTGLLPDEYKDIIGVIPFKGYNFSPGEFPEIVMEMVDLNPDYSVLGYTDGAYHLVVFQAKENA